MTTISTRTTHTIATEINSIKDQTRQIMLHSSIEIGRRLVEAKSMLKHGEWGNWLKESVDYSQSTANNLMKVFEEYGSDQLSLFGDNAKSQTLGNLSYTQAVALLSIPTEEREAFVQENEVENMSTRELQKAIKEKQDLEKKLQKAEEQAELERMNRERIQRSLDEMEQQNQMNYELAERYKHDIEAAADSGDQKKAAELQAELDKHRAELKEAEKKVKELQKELKAKPIEIPAKEIVERVPDEVQQELAQLREQVKRNSNKAMAKFSVCFETVVKDFDNLLGSLYEIKNESPEDHAKYMKAVAGLLERMGEKVK
ncbi:Chromosome partition protein Smc [compost metagenome]